VTRRLLVGAAIAAAALAALIKLELAHLARREYLPSDPGYVVDTVVEPRIATAGDAVRIAVLGDSTVAGVGSPSEMESLPVLIGRRVADAMGRRVRVVGYGVSGARTATLTSDQLPRVAGAHDAVVLVIGSNDATHATPWWRFRGQTAAMLRGATRLGAPVVLAGTPRFAGTEIIPEPLRTIVDRYSGILRREQRAAASGMPGVSFVDLAADASPRFAGVPEATSSDGFHPSPIGYGFWADAISPSVVAALDRAG
jgi:lysophospholipase L1-like esterase